MHIELVVNTIIPKYNFINDDIVIDFELYLCKKTREINDKEIDELIELSKRWKEEDVTFGYGVNSEVC